jgi:replication factor C small subunit
MQEEIEIWTEKYRPMTIENLMGMDDKIEQLQGFVEKKNLPHLLLVGPPGTEQLKFLA